MVIKNFHIHSLTGKFVIFDFDIENSLKNFRKHIDESYPYTLFGGGCECIFWNDNLEASILSIIKLYHSSILTGETIHLYLTLNFGYPKKREGKLLLSEESVSKIEQNEFCPPILICPISLSLIKYAVKLYDRFYELNCLAEYLSVEINKLRSNQDYKLKCPLKNSIDIYGELMIEIIHWHYVPSTKKFNEVNRSSVETFFLQSFLFLKSQKEYNNLLLNYAEK